MEREGRLVLAPINPFTLRQREIIKLKLEGLTHGEVAERLGLKYQTVKNYIAGSSTDKSIHYIMEMLTGHRPSSKNFIPPLIDDVIFFRDENK